MPVFPHVFLRPTPHPVWLPKAVGLVGKRGFKRGEHQSIGQKEIEEILALSA